MVKTPAWAGAASTAAAAIAAAAASAPRVIRDLCMLLKSAHRAADDIGHPSRDGSPPMPAPLRTSASTPDRIATNDRTSAAPPAPSRALRRSGVRGPSVAGISRWRSSPPRPAILDPARACVRRGVPRPAPRGVPHRRRRLLPTQLIFVPMLLLLPTPLVPLLVVAACTSADGRRRARPARRRPGAAPPTTPRSRSRPRWCWLRSARRPRTGTCGPHTWPRSPPSSPPTPLGRCCAPCSRPTCRRGSCWPSSRRLIASTRCSRPPACSPRSPPPRFPPRRC